MTLKKAAIITTMTVAGFFILIWAIDYIRIDTAKIDAHIYAIETKSISTRADAELKQAYKRVKAIKMLKQELGSIDNVMQYLKK